MEHRSYFAPDENAKARWCYYSFFKENNLATVLLILLKEEWHHFMQVVGKDFKLLLIHLWLFLAGLILAHHHISTTINFDLEKRNFQKVAGKIIRIFFHRNKRKRYSLHVHFQIRTQTIFFLIIWLVLYNNYPSVMSS